jgi:O-antigen ligase
LAEYAVLDLWIDRLRRFGLDVTALALFSAPAGVSIGLGLVTLAFALRLFRRPAWPVSPAVAIAAGFTVYVLMLGASARYPGGTFDVRFETALQWANVRVLVPVASVLAGHQRRVLRLLGLALIGLILGALWRLDWALLLSEPGDFVQSRPGFGFPPIVFALFSGTALLGLVTLRRRCWGGDGRRALRLALCWLVTLAVAQGFLLTLSRGAWLALALTVGVGLLAGVRSAPQRPSLRVALVLGTAATVLAVIYAGPMAERLAAEWEAVRGILAGEIAYAPESSLSQRWHAQRFGLAAWLQHPWLGWGPGAAEALLAASQDPAVVMIGHGPIDHLHNTYLEVMVQLGLVGLVLWLALFLMLLQSVRLAGNAGRIDPDLERFLRFAVVYLMLWCLFDFHALHQSWRAYWALLAGSALSVGLFVRSADGATRGGGGG